VRTLIQMIFIPAIPWELLDTVVQSVPRRTIKPSPEIVQVAGLPCGNSASTGTASWVYLQRDE